MQERRSAVKKGCSKEGMQERRDSGLQGPGIQEKRDLGLAGFRTGGIQKEGFQDWRDTGKEGFTYLADMNACAFSR